MRSWKWMLGAAALAALLPSQGTDVAKLKPAELLCVHSEGTELVIQTDTGDKGRGDTAESALEDLKQTADGDIFLDTVEFLLIAENTEYDLNDFAQALRPTVRPCILRGEADLQAAAKYLSAHPLHASLRKKTIAVLTSEKGWFHLNAEASES